LMGLLISIATLAFIYGIFKYVVSKDAESRQSSTKVIIFGLITLFVMVSVWGLVALVKGTLGITDANITNSQTQSVQNLILK